MSLLSKKISELQERTQHAQQTSMSQLVHSRLKSTSAINAKIQNNVLHLRR